MALPWTGQITIEAIDAELGLGTNLKAYQGIRVLKSPKGGGQPYLVDLPTTTIKFSDFRGIGAQPPEEYPTPKITVPNWLTETFGYLNTGDIKLDGTANIDWKNDSWPTYRPTPTDFNVTYTWFKWDGSQFIELSNTNKTLSISTLSEVNEGTYAVEVKADLIAPSDAENPAGDITNKVIVASSIVTKVCAVDIREFSIANPSITFSNLATTSTVIQVRQYEGGFQSTESDKFTYNIDVTVEFSDGTNFGKPFSSLPTASAKLQKSADGISWTDVTGNVTMPETVTASSWTGSNPSRKIGWIDATSVGGTKASGKYTLKNRFRFELDDWLDTNENGYSYRILVSASSGYDNPSVTKTASSGSTARELKIVLANIIRDNTCPVLVSPASYTIPVGGIKSVNISAIASDDVDNEEVRVTGAYIDSGSGTVSYGDGYVELDQTGLSFDGTTVVKYTVTDDSTRPGGPCIQEGIINFSNTNDPPVAVNYTATVQWTLPGQTPVWKDFDLSNRFDDINGDAVSLDIDHFNTVNQYNGTWTIENAVAVKVVGNTVSIKFAAGKSGKANFLFRCKDSKGAVSDPKTGTITVQKTNVAPYISNGRISVDVSYGAQPIPYDLTIPMSITDYEGSAVYITSTSGDNRVYKDPTKNNKYVYINLADAYADWLSDKVGWTPFTIGPVNITVTDGTDSSTAQITIDVINTCPVVTTKTLPFGNRPNNEAFDYMPFIKNNYPEHNEYGGLFLASFSLVSGPGEAARVGEQAFYSPNGGTGTFELAFTISNGCGSSGSGTITGTLYTPNSAPAMNNITVNLAHGATKTFVASVYVDDADGDTVKFYNALNFPNNNGTLDLPEKSTATSMTYSAGSTTTAFTDKFYIHGFDGQALSPRRTLTVNVAAKPAAPQYSMSISPNPLEETAGKSVTITVEFAGENYSGKSVTITPPANFGGVAKKVTAPANGAAQSVTFTVGTTTAEYYASKTVTFTAAGHSDFLDSDQTIDLDLTCPAPWLAEFYNWAPSDTVVVDEGKTFTVTPVGRRLPPDWRSVSYDSAECDEGTQTSTLTWNGSNYVGDTLTFTATHLTTDYNDKTGTITATSQQGTPKRTFTINNIDVVIPTVYDVDAGVHLVGEDVGPIPWADNAASLNNDGTYTAWGRVGSVQASGRWSSLTDNTGWSIETKTSRVVSASGTAVKGYSNLEIAPEPNYVDFPAYAGTYGRNGLSVQITFEPALGNALLANYPNNKSGKHTCTATLTCQYRVTDGNGNYSNWATFTGTAGAQTSRESDSTESQPYVGGIVPGSQNCEGTTYVYKQYTNINGSWKWVRIENSTACGYVEPVEEYPAAGTLIAGTEYCDGYDRRGEFHDGKGDTYDGLIESNSTVCGYKAVTYTIGAEAVSECISGTTTRRYKTYTTTAGAVSAWKYEYNSTACGYVAPTYTIGAVVPNTAKCTGTTLTYDVYTTTAGATKTETVLNSVACGYVAPTYTVGAVAEEYCVAGTYTRKYKVYTTTSGDVSAWKTELNSRTCGYRGVVGGGGGGCPTPDMLIKISETEFVPAGELKIGDTVWTQHEHTKEWGNYTVSNVDIWNDQQRLCIEFDDGYVFTGSYTHKFEHNGEWKEIQDMLVGDTIQGKTIVSIKDIPAGDVVKITVEDAHTYITGDMLSHNKLEDNTNVSQR